MHVGFIGLGAMGGPMAMNILKGGHELTVYDTNAAAPETLRRAGARVAENYPDLASTCELVITMLPDPTHVQTAVLGSDGMITGLRRRTVFIDMSTGDPHTARHLDSSLRTAGVDVIDCPVGRTQTHAEAGTLLLLAGGDPDVISTARPVLDCIGSDFIHCGGPGSGQAMKLVNNMLATVALQGVAEALSLGFGAGLSLETMRTVMGQTMAQTSQLDHALPAKTFAGDLEPGFALSLARKDVRLAVELAHRLGMSVPAAERTLERCAELVASGRGGDDIGVLVADIAPGVLPAEPSSEGSV